MEKNITFLMNKIIEEKQWDLNKTAAVVIDVWDHHWCAGVDKRIPELAPKINQFLKYLRCKGIKKVIHCPTGTSQAYANTYARQMTTYFKNEPIDIPTLDIPDISTIADPYHVECDCLPKCQRKMIQKSQHSNIKILGDTEDVVLNYDLICDEYSDKNPEKEEWHFFHALKALGIENILIMGAYLNSSLIYSKYGIKNLVALKYNVVLVEDLVDGMFPKEEMPYKNHFDVQDEVLEYIRQYLCPTTRTTDITGEQSKNPYFGPDKRFLEVLPFDSNTAHSVFEQSEERKKAKHRLPSGIKVLFSSSGFLQKWMFVYDLYTGSSLKSDDKSEIIIPFYPCAKIDSCVLYIKKGRL